MATDEQRGGPISAADVRETKPVPDLVDRLLEGSVRAKLFGDASGSSPKLGRLAVLDPVGSGSMGTVFAAYDPKLDRKVAVKVLRGSAGEETEKLLEEARSLSKLNHPNVVSVYDAGERDGSVYLVMEFVAGPTLDCWLAGSGSESDSSATAEARDWLSSLAVLRAAGDGLAAAHAAGVVHCDVKPQNIIVSRDRPRVLDFGLATIVSADGDGERHGAGTPSYMAPEVLGGDAPTAASDQFSYAVTVFEALYGTRPHTGATIDELAQTVCRAAASPRPKGSSVPMRVDAALRRALAVKPEARFDSIESLIRALTPRRPRWPFVVAALGAAALIGLVGYRSGIAEGSVGEECNRGDVAVAEWKESADYREARRALSAQSESWSERAFVLIDAHADRWALSYRNVCEATRVDGGQSEALLDVRMSCLARNLDRREALVSETATLADQRTAAKVATAAAGLEEPRGCESTAVGGRARKRPEIEAAIRRRERAVARGWAAYSLGRYDATKKAIATIDEAAADIEPRLLADLRLLEGTVQGRTGEASVAKSILSRALLEAAQAGDPSLEVRVWTQILRNELFGGSPGLVVELVPFASSSLARLGEDKPVFDSILGEAYRKLGRFDEARAALKNALSSDNDPLERSFAHLNYGAIMLASGSASEAEAHIVKGLQETAHVLGPDHPQTALFRDRLGDCALARGEHQRAQALFEETLRMRMKYFGGGDRATGSSLLRSGRASLEAGALEAAEISLERALAIRESAYGEEHLRTAEPLEALGDLALARNHPLEALVHYEAATVADPTSAALGKAVVLAVQEGKLALVPSAAKLLAAAPNTAGDGEARLEHLWALLATIERGSGRDAKLIAKKRALTPVTVPSWSLVAGRILHRLGEDTQAERVLRTGLENYAERTGRTRDAIEALLTEVRPQRRETLAYP